MLNGLINFNIRVSVYRSVFSKKIDIIEGVLTWMDCLQVVAEFIGTFFLIFAGCGSVVIDKKTNDSITHLGVSLVWEWQ